MAELERSALEGKDRDELVAIATALGGKPASRAKKADIISLILDLTGVTSADGDEAPEADTEPSAPEAASDDAEATAHRHRRRRAPARKPRSRPRSGWRRPGPGQPRPTRRPPTPPTTTDDAATADTEAASDEAASDTDCRRPSAEPTREGRPARQAGGRRAPGRREGDGGQGDDRSRRRRRAGRGRRPPSPPPGPRPR